MAQGKRTDPLIAAQLMGFVDAGYPASQAGEMVGVAPRTAQDIVRCHGQWGEVAEKPVFARLRAEQNQILEALARKMAADSWVKAAEKIDKASYYQLVMGGAIMLDKARLLAGESTENVAHLHRHEVAGLDDLAVKLADVLHKD